MTLYKPKFCILPEQLTYTIVKRKNMGLVLLFKAHYSREHQANHSTRKCLQSQSVLQAFTSSLSLDTAKSPHWHWERSCCSLARAQVRDWGWHSTSCTHRACTQLTLCLPQLPLWQWALSPIHTAPVTENTSTANQEHLQEHCSFPLCLDSLLKWGIVVVQINDSHTPLHWVKQHTPPFSTSWPDPSVFWQWEQNREQITQSLALEPEAESEWHNRKA